MFKTIKITSGFRFTGFGKINKHPEVHSMEEKTCIGQCCGSGMFISDPGSDFFLSWIPDPNCFHPGSRIRIKEIKYFNPKKWFLSSRKYPGCSTRIPDPDFFYPSRIPDPGVKRHRIPDPGSASATLAQVNCSFIITIVVDL